MATLDWAVLALYVVVVICLGIWAGGKEKSTDDFFLAGRSMTWLPVAVSSLATTLSALTFIGVPGAAYGGNFVYFQLKFGTFIGAFLVAQLFLPAFYRLKVTTVYELLGDRFGPVSRTSGTVVFIISRVMASAVRLAGCAIAVSVFFSVERNTAIVLIAIFAMLYTASGGIKAVIWTDILQFSLFFVGACASILIIWDALPGGFSQFVSIGETHEKFRTFNFAWDVSDATTFWAGNLFAAVMGLAVGATDQDIAQRVLTCRDVRHAQKAAYACGASSFLTTLIFLTVGASLFAYYQAFPDAGIAEVAAMKPPRYDRIFPHFILHALPAGMRGMLVAALMAAAMSSLDSALNGLASTVYIDLYLPFFKKSDKGGESNVRSEVRFSRVLIVCFGTVLALVAMTFGAQESILWFGLKIMGYTYGALLGVFLLAVLTRHRGSEIGNVVAMTTSVLVVVFLTAGMGESALASARAVLLSPLRVSQVAWPWGIVIGTIWTFGVGAAWLPRERSLSPSRQTVRRRAVPSA